MEAKKKTQQHTSAYWQAFDLCKNMTQMKVYFALASNRGRNDIKLTDSMLGRLAGVDRHYIPDAVEALKKARIITVVDGDTTRSRKVYTMMDSKLAERSSDYYSSKWEASKEGEKKKKPAKPEGKPNA